MNFSFSKGPPGPLYTIVLLQFTSHSPNQHSVEKQSVWAECIRYISRNSSWSYALRGETQEDDTTPKVVLIISWKGTTDTLLPSWTSPSQDTSTSTPLTPLFPLLDSPPTILNVAFRPLLPSVNLHSNTITDITTLYIPTSMIDTPTLADLNNQLHAFGSEAAHVSHESPGPMISSSRGWGAGEIDRDGKKMVVHVLMHTWGSKEEERGYKEGGNGTYKKLFLEPLGEAENLGVEYEITQVGELDSVKLEEEGKEKGGCVIM